MGAISSTSSFNSVGGSSSWCFTWIEIFQQFVTPVCVTISASCGGYEVSSRVMFSELLNGLNTVPCGNRDVSGTLRLQLVTEYRQRVRWRRPARNDAIQRCRSPRLWIRSRTCTVGWVSQSALVESGSWSPSSRPRHNMPLRMTYCQCSFFGSYWVLFWKVVKSLSGTCPSWLWDEAVVSFLPAHAATGIVQPG